MQPDIEERLRSTRTQLKLITDYSSDIIAQISDDTEIVYISPSVEDILGISPEELIGRKSTELIGTLHTDDRLMEPHPDEVSLATFEYPPIRVRHADGHYIWLEIHVTPIQDSTGVWSMVVNAREVTKRVNLEAENHYQNELYRALANHLPDTAIFLFDNEMRFQLVEGGLVESVPNEREIYEGKLLHEAVDPQRLAVLEPIYRKTLNGKPTYNHEVNRKGRYYQQDYVPLRDKQGNVTHGLVVNRDIHEFRLMQQSLQKGKEQLRIIAENVERVLGYVNLDGEVEYVNPQWYKMTGYDPSSDFGRDATDKSALHPEDQITYLTCFEDCINSGSLMRGNSVFDTKVDTISSLILWYALYWMIDKKCKEWSL